MIYAPLYVEAGNFVTNLFRVYQANEMMYHNLSHTQNVVVNSKLIAEQYDLTEYDLFILQMAAWFHDTGHLFGLEVGHEAKSAIIMKDFFEYKIDERMIDTISSCILATKLASSPENLLQRILCDADLFHLGTSEFFTKNKLVKQEYEWRYNTTIPDWEIKTWVFMTEHTFFTDYCKKNLCDKKEENIRLLSARIDKNNIL